LSKEIDCDSVLEQVSDFVDEDQREEICQAIRQHLEHCQDCRIFVDKFKKTIILYRGNLKASELSIQTTAKLSAAISAVYAEAHRTN
jgi:predicted anti-sigma-YlaC factor YlaD